MTRISLTSIAAPLAWTAFIAWPLRGGGLLDGVPLGPFEALAIAVVWWLWAADRRLRGGVTLLVLLLAKAAAGGLMIERGLEARYYANAEWRPPVETSTEFRRADITRVDERLAFGDNAARDLPLFYFNHVRFNYYQRHEPARETLAYSARWNGYFFTERDGTAAEFYLAASPGARGLLRVDDRAVVALPPDAEAAGFRSATATLDRGWHRVSVEVAAPNGTQRRVEAGEIVDGVRHPLGTGLVLPSPAGDGRLLADTAARAVAWVLDAGVLLWLAVLGAINVRRDWSESRTGRLLWLGAIADAALFAVPMSGRLTVLSGGNDWLTYEYYAREIVLGDPLLRRQGGPFYYQPLYPYFVALVHVVFGEDLSGVAFLQRLLLAATAGWLGAITARLAGLRAGRVATIGGGLFLYAMAGRWAGILLAEPLFTPVLAWWCWRLVKTATEPWRTGALLSAGLVGGVATLIRSTLLLGWPVIVPAWAAALPMSRKRRLGAAVLLVAIMVGVVSTATLRNWVVARQFVPIASSGSINLWIGNEPPATLAPAPPQRQAVYDRLGADLYVRSVAEYAFQAPEAFLRNLGRKAIYAVGLFEYSGLTGTPGSSWVYVSLWLLAIAGLGQLLKAPGVHPRVLLALPALTALTHLAVVVLFFPHGYGDRLILPLYPLLVPYAAVAMLPLLDWTVGHVRAAGAALLALLVLLAFLSGFDRAPDIVAALAIAAVLLAVSIEGRPRIERRAWPYIGYALATAGGFALLAGGPGFRRQLLLPLIAFAAARLVRDGVVRLALLGALLAGAVIHVITEPATTGVMGSPYVWVGAGALGATVAAAARSRTVAPAAALLAAALIAVAVVAPHVQGPPPDLEDQLGDLRRDVSVLVSGAGDEAWQDLGADLRSTANLVSAPAISGFGRVGGWPAALCLIVLWILVLRRGVRGALAGSAAHAASAGALVVGLLALLAGVVPAQWEGSGDSLVILGLLLGVAESPAPSDGLLSPMEAS